MKFGRSAAGAKVTVIGGGPSALSCAYYLTLAGCKVNVFAQEDQPGGELRKISDTNPLLKTAVLHDVEGVMSSGISYQGDLQLWKNLDFKNILEINSAVYLAVAGLESGHDTYSTWLGANWRDSLDGQTGQVTSLPGVFIGEEFLMNGVSVVEAAAHGRKTAISIRQFLG